MYERHSHTLSRAECEELLASAKIGRVILTEQALPTALPVAYALDSGDIVFRSNDTSKVALALDGTVIAFQVDHIDEHRGAGWSVVATGLATPMTDPDDQQRAAELGIQAWVDSGGPRFVRLSPTIITGLRITYQPV